MDYEIKHRESGHKGAFYMEENGKEIALIDYSITGPDKIIASHTEVNPEYKGQGLGDKILEHMADYARENNIKIIALCPFIKARFERYKEKYQDVIG